MKTIEIPEINNIYYTLAEIIDLFQTLKLIRFTQERYKREQKSTLLEYYQQLQLELSKKIERVNSFCTPLEYLSEYLANRLEDCKQIEIVENRKITVKQSIHEKCKKHYPNLNNSRILNKLCLNNVEGKYASFEYRLENGIIAINIVNKLGECKKFYFNTIYQLVYVFWDLGDGKICNKMFNGFRHIIDAIIVV